MMIYYGNEREDGRVMQPHELIYKNYILDCLTGSLTAWGINVDIPLEGTPIDFLARYDHKNYLCIFIIYSDYAKLYKANVNDCIEKVKDIGKYNHYSCTTKGRDIKISKNGTRDKYKGFVDECKQLVRVISCYIGDTRHKSLRLTYIDHENNVHPSEGSYKLLDRFIIINYYRRLRIYDIEKHILFDVENKLSPAFNELKDRITDIVVYMDNIEIYTDKENYYIQFKLLGDPCFKILPEDWSVKPTFRVQPKSARKID